MKLSERTTESVIDIMCTVAPLAQNIIEDNNVWDVIGKKVKKDGATVAQMYAGFVAQITTLVPVLLKNHKKDVFGILSALNDMSEEDISNQNILVTLKQIQDVFSDEVLVDFFKSWRQPGTKK